MVIEELHWNTTQASNMAYYESALVKITEASEDAYTWFNDKPPQF